jgi:hypothetical protein
MQIYWNNRFNLKFWEEYEAKEIKAKILENLNANRSTLDFSEISVGLWPLLPIAG